MSRKNFDGSMNGVTGPSEAHRRIVARLVSEGCSAKGLFKDVLAATGVDLKLCGKWWPDAYRIADKEVHIYEVQVFHGLTESKLAKLRSSHALLSDAGWALRLFAVDRNGGRVELDVATGEVTQAEMERAVAMFNRVFS